jgi:3-deoxy-7-phosphoheptulonate synthase
MIIVLKPTAVENDKEQIFSEIKSQGFDPKPVDGEKLGVICVVGSKPISQDWIDHLSVNDAIEEIKRITSPYKLVAKEAWNGQKVGIVSPKGEMIEFDNGTAIMIAGPCSVENKESLNRTVCQLSRVGGLRFVRAGAFKPRTNPYEFQGLGEEGLIILSEVSKKYDMLNVSEMVSISDAEIFNKYVDIIQIGARNIQNFDLLKVVGQLNKPVILKRGFATTITEFLCSAEYVASRQNKVQIILCLRGMRTFDDSLRNTPDIHSIPVLKKKTWLPVIFDPSHATGMTDMVPSMAMAAIAADADGLIIEAHYDPSNAECDAQQTMSVQQLEKLRMDLAPIAAVRCRQLK